MTTKYTLTKSSELFNEVTVFSAEIIINEENVFLRISNDTKGTVIHSENRHISSLAETFQALYDAGYRNENN